MLTEPTRLRLAGILFLAAFLAYGIGTGLVTQIAESSDPLTSLASGSTTMGIGALLMLLNSLIVLGIGGLLFAPLARRDRAAPRWYLLTRCLEAGFLAWGAFGFLALAWGDGVPTLEAITAANRTNTLVYQIAMFVLGLGSLPFCALLLRGRLVPRWLAAWGLAGYAIFALGALLELAGPPYGLVLSIPAGLFEIAFGIRLIAKGFSHPVPPIPDPEF